VEEKKTARVWMTKYWETKGIFEVPEAALIDGKYALGLTDPSNSFFCRLGSDAFLSKEEALAAVEKKRLKKIASLEKKIKALKNYTPVVSIVAE